jgi:hypothetical protein
MTAPFVEWLNKVLDLKLPEKHGLPLSTPGFPEPGEMNIAAWREGRSLPHPRVLRGLVALLLLDEAHWPLHDEWRKLADMDANRALPSNSLNVGRGLDGLHPLPTLGHYVWEPAWEDVGAILKGVSYDKREGFMREVMVKAMLLKAGV